MGKVESTIKSEIQRLAKREVRAFFLPLRREVGAMRMKLSSLSKSISPLNRMAKERLRQEEKKEIKLEATPEEVKASRLTPERIRSLRKKLGLSQRELGILVGASLGAVQSWEKGKFKAGGEKKVALVALRMLKKRDVRKLLAGKTETKVKGKGKKLRSKMRKNPAGKKALKKKSR